MAYVQTLNDDKDNQQAGDASAPTVQTNVGQSVSVGGTASTPNGAKASSGRFTNIQKYLGANQGAGEQIAGKVGIKVDISSSDNTGTLVATKVKNAIEAASYDFIIQQSTDTLRLRTANSGNATDASNVGVTGLVITKIQDGAGEDVAKRYVRLSTLPSPSQRIDDTARSLAKVISDNVGETVTAYYISGPSDVPGKLNFEAKLITTGVFTITSSDASLGALFSPDITSAQSSTNEEKVNRLYYSKTNQPEAVPIVNYFDIGPQDRPIYRIIGIVSVYKK